MRAMATEEQEAEFREITHIYDIADDLLATVESEFVSNPEEQLAVVEPLVEQIGASADILSEEYIALMATGKSNPQRKSKVESALRKLFIAMDDYAKRAKAKAGNHSGTLANIADPIVARLRRQVERVVAVFAHWMQLTLSAIASRQQLEQMRRHEARISEMLSNQKHQR